MITLVGVLDFNIDINYQITPSDGHICKQCEQVIIGDMWQLNKYLNGKRIEPSKEYAYCQDCYLTYITTNDESAEDSILP